MRKQILYFFFIVLASLFTLNSCSNSTHDPVLNRSNLVDNSKVLQIRMHDVPISGQNVEKVNIEIQNIEVHHVQNGWISVSDEPQTLNLLELQNGVTAIIFNKPLEIGKYTQIRLVLKTNNEVYVKGRPYRLRIPSGVETGVKLVTPFEIKEGKMVDVVVDFDVLHSVNLTKGQGFTLKPVIKVDGVAEYDGVGLVTPSGGVVKSVDGDFTLIVPAGAVAKSELLSMDKVDISQYPQPDSDITFVGNAYNLSPNGYQFTSPVTLQASYTDADHEISSLGARENLKLFTFNESDNQWETVPSTAVPSVNVVNGLLAHFSVYVIGIERTCSDGVKNGDESGIDCGGTCSAVCVDCNDYAVLNGADPTGSGPMADVYSFGDPAVKQVAAKAVSEYADYLSNLYSRTVYTSDINTPDLKIEAVSRYVHRHMAWMEDEGDVNWNQLFSTYMPLSSLSLGDITNPVNLITDPNPLNPIAPLIVGPAPLPISLVNNNVFDMNLQTSVDQLFDLMKATVDNPTSFMTLAQNSFQDFMCQIGNSINISQSDIDPVFNYFLGKVYQKVQDIYPDAKPQTAAYTATQSIHRSGHDDNGNGPYSCPTISSYSPPDISTTGARLGPDTRYCGDCEDFAVFRASLLRHLGVSSQCVMNVDYHDSPLWGAPYGGSAELVPVSINGAVGKPAPYDYETASDLFKTGASDSGSGGHTFNTVLYQSKYRIMDYGEVRRDTYAFNESTDTNKNSHSGEHIWNDQFGHYWFPEFGGLTNPSFDVCNINLNPTDIGALTQSLGISLSYTSPGKKAQNYPGSVACYEPGYLFWTFKSWYGNICP